MKYCKNCEFYKPNPMGSGTCVRFPTTVHKNPHDYCGEFSQAKSDPFEAAKPVEPTPVVEKGTKRGKK